MLYSGHKESGLIRISLSIGLAGLDGRGGCTWTEKGREARHGLPAQNGICPCSPLPDAHLASGSSFFAGMHSTFPAVIRSPGLQSRASQMLRIVERVTVSWYL